MITEDERKTFIKLFNLYWLAAKSGLVYTDCLVFTTILHELHHTEAEFNVEIGTKDPNGESLSDGYNDMVYILWNDIENDKVCRAVIPANYLTPSVLVMLYKHSPTLTSGVIHYVSQTETYDDEDIYDELLIVSKRSVNESLYMLRGNNDVFESARTRWNRHMNKSR